MKKILFFSNNNNKIGEVKKIFNGIDYKIFSPKDFNLNFVPKEIGKSFIENAKIKSEFGFRKTKMPCFADDSGICIDALAGKPNIHSRKFLESFKNNSECFKYIIDKVKSSGKNKAYFQTSICYSIKNDYHIVFTGKVNGVIANKIAGKRGFGFDPIFIPEGYKKTYSEITTNKKNLISHRSIATNKLISFLLN